MEVLFLYHRLLHTAEKQLESLMRSDFLKLEKLTQEREETTKALCESLEKEGFGEGKKSIPESVQRRIHEITAKTLDIDAEIKEILLEELRKRTLEFSPF